MAEFKVKLKPLTVPEHVYVDNGYGRREDGFKEGHKIRIEDLDVATIKELCEELKETMIKKVEDKTYGQGWR